MFLDNFFKKRYIDFQSNSFDILRLLLAIFVLVSHSTVIGKYREDITIDIGMELLSPGSFAVYSFFVISGVLITRSGVNSSSVSSFIKKRLLRIFPGYWAALIFGGFIVTPLLYKLSNTGFSIYFKSYIVEYISYIYQNIAGDVQFRYIGPLFDSLPTKVLNGSLWTLIHELRMYMIIALMMVFGVVSKIRYHAILFGICFFINVLGHSTNFSYNKELTTILDSKEIHTLIFGTYFFAGALFYHFYNKIYFNWLLFSVATVTFVGSLMLNVYPILGPFLLAYMTLFLAIVLPFRNVIEKIGDLSYGIYIYAFPIQLLLVSLNVHLQGYLIYTLLSILITGIISYLSYHFLEKKFLKISHIKV
jgi:peptidoglycan/LPS O-acetylase OafA/YrhL